MCVFTYRVGPMTSCRLVPALGACLCAVLAFVSVPFARAQEAAEEAPPKSFVEALERAGVKLIQGPANYRLGSVAELRLPEGYRAVEAGSLERYYELTQNLYDSDDLGIVIGPQEWVLAFSYDDIGHVKDDEKNELDADKLMKAMTEGQQAANKERAKQGWDEMKFAGWANQPHYDQATNNLTWAVRLTSSSDGHKEAFLNESIRLLGRGGVMNVTLVTDPQAYDRDHAEASALLAKNFGYVEGQRYADFREGDKVAKYGLTALVLGGAGAAAFKLGFFQKFWKLLALGGVAVAAGLKRMWARMTGREVA
jgi:uncharacterized membrane-anchored protein